MQRFLDTFTTTRSTIWRHPLGSRFLNTFNTMRRFLDTSIPTPQNALSTPRTIIPHPKINEISRYLVSHILRNFWHCLPHDFPYLTNISLSKASDTLSNYQPPFAEHHRIFKSLKHPTHFQITTDLSRCTPELTKFAAAFLTNFDTSLSKTHDTGNC